MFDLRCNFSWLNALHEILMESRAYAQTPLLSGAKSEFSKNTGGGGNVLQLQLQP
jgi:hypothetical protein